MVHTVNYGTSVIRYSVSRSNRKTLAIEVHPDMSIKVVAPTNATLSAIKERILKRARWIRKQQRYFEQFLPRTPKREYVSGESHYYLGRKYILRIRKGPHPSVKVKGSSLLLIAHDPEKKEQVREILASWYSDHAVLKFSSALDEALQRSKNFKIKNPQLVIRRMARRWGSCTPNGKILINPEIIKAPSKCIEYVIVHELCHLLHPNHSQAFYSLLSKVMPEWKKWKMKLERVMA